MGGRHAKAHGSAGGGYTGFFRRYDIEVDGVVLGKVGRNETAGFEVAEGVHKVRVRVDWCGSKVVDVPVGPDGADLVMETNPLLPWLAVIYIFMPDEWFTLRPANAARNVV